MARIKIETFFERFESEIKKSLESTLEEHLDNQDYDIREIYKTFKRKFIYKCNTWERIPDKMIDLNNPSY